VENHTFKMVKDIDFSQPLPSRRTCSLHANFELEYFCREDEVPLCAKCAIEDHNNHSLCPLSQVVSQVKDDILKAIAKVFPFLFLCSFSLFSFLFSLL